MVQKRTVEADRLQSAESSEIGVPLERFRCIMKHAIFAADLHLHSHYASAVSPAMTVENIASMARLKGIDVIGTGDCLQPDWLDALEAKLVEAEPGWFALRPEVEAVLDDPQPTAMRRPLRFVLSTELHCAPPGSGEVDGIHYLVYFRSFASARHMQRRLQPYGNLKEGRPRLTLTALQLLKAVLNHSEPCEFAPAHIWNPYFSVFGSHYGVSSMETLFGDLAPQVRLAETGLTSTAEMCRRFSELDACALFSCSDAHSLDNIGRECTRVEAEPGFDPLFAALKGGGPGRVVGTIKYPLEHTRYYRNWCSRCRGAWPGTVCPSCGKTLVMGAHDRLDHLADRPAGQIARNWPDFRQLLPLREIIAKVCQCKPSHKTVDKLYTLLVPILGHERYILNEANEAELADATTPQLARAICQQRTVPPNPKDSDPQQGPDEDQLGFNLT